MLERLHPTRSKHRLRLLASLVSSIALLAGCANMESPSRPATGASTSSGVPTSVEQGRSWDQLLEVADTTAAKGEFGTAAVLYREAHFQRPDAELPLRRLGPILLKMGHPLEASEAYKSLLAMNEQEPSARLGLARSLIALNRPYAASLQFQRITEGQPDNIEALIGLGVSYDLMGDHEQAQETFRSGLAFEPRNTSLLNNLGHSLTRAGRFDDAIEVLQFAVDLPGTSARHRHNLALAYGLAGKLREAAEMMSHDLDRPSMQQNMAYFRSQQFPRQLSSLAPPPVEQVAPPKPPAAAQEQAPTSPAPANKPLAQKAPTEPSSAARKEARAPAPKESHTAAKPAPKPAATAMETQAPTATQSKTAAAAPGIGSTPHATATALTNSANATAAIAPPVPDGEENKKDSKSRKPFKSGGLDTKNSRNAVDDNAGSTPVKLAEATARAVPQETADATTSSPTDVQDREVTLLAELSYHASPLPSATTSRSDVRASEPPVTLFKVGTESSAN